LRLFSFGDHGLALAALALVVFGAYDSYPTQISTICNRFWESREEENAIFQMYSQDLPIFGILLLKCRVLCSDAASLGKDIKQRNTRPRKFNLSNLQ